MKGIFFRFAHVWQVMNNARRNDYKAEPEMLGRVQIEIGHWEKRIQDSDYKPEQEVPDDVQASK